MKQKNITKLCIFLIYLGAIDLGIEGLTGSGIIRRLFGFFRYLPNIIYVIIGLAAIYLIIEKMS